MLAKRHLVTRGESLASIAKRYLGDVSRWPEIYTYNNLPTVTQDTGTRIQDPNLIFVGQKLWIPPKDERLNVKPLHGVAQATAPAKEKICSPTFEYNLDALKPMELLSKTYKIRVRFKGSIRLQSGRLVTFKNIQCPNYEHTAEKSARLALAALLDPKWIQLTEASHYDLFTLACGFTKFAPTKATAKSQLKMSFSKNPSKPPTPHITFTFPRLQGVVAGYGYDTTNLRALVTLEPKKSKIDIKLPIPENIFLKELLDTTGQLVGYEHTFDIQTATLEAIFYRVEVKLKGTVKLDFSKNSELFTLSSKGVKIGGKHQVTEVVQGLVYEQGASVDFDWNNRFMGFEYGLASRCDYEFGAKTGIAVGISASGFPYLKATFTAPPLRGQEKLYPFTVENLEVEVKIELRNPLMRVGKATRDLYKIKLEPIHYIYGIGIVAGVIVLTPVIVAAVASLKAATVATAAAAAGIAGLVVSYHVARSILTRSSSASTNFSPKL